LHAPKLGDQPIKIAQILIFNGQNKSITHHEPTPTCGGYRFPSIRALQLHMGYAGHEHMGWATTFITILFFFLLHLLQCLT
jgi:hypothetical protein